MQTRSLYLTLILASLCSGAHAGLNKCKGPNGHPVYQNAPCPPPASAYAKKMPTLAERNALVRQQKLAETKERYADDRPGANWDPSRKPTASMPPPVHVTAPVQPGVQAQAKPAATQKAAPGGSSKSEYEQKLAAEKLEADNAKIRAKNKSIDCNNERQQLAVVRDGRGVHTVDNKGNRNFISDPQRDAAITEAERRVARACR
ncbi:DUF4124 domain-containing protein [Massilia sp. CCM 8734]|uniref:DUF4124 domain-containing protein n=1 Tax=Massilia sp. CCM 8734 TaxID=2609283 RepID=UPI00142120F8|nr:DUF4124 domain-containing protein [Massilia sp. CCM 8734]NHZ94147.1 DUF4124 domain-containing protein [Massilia sp. CCM 8734]